MKDLRENEDKRRRKGEETGYKQFLDFFSFFLVLQ